MRHINQRNYVGKKVTQVEQELKTQKNYILHVVSGVLGLIIVLMAVNIFSLKQDIANLKIESGKLLKDNTALKVQVETSKVETISTEQKPVPQNEIIYHHIQSGDNLPSISAKYYGKELYAKPLAQINGLSANSLLQPGQVLQIPREPDPTWGY